VLQPGERWTSDRVIDEIGSMAAASLHYWWELYQKDGDTSTVAGRCRNLWDEYLAFTEKMETPPNGFHRPIAGTAPSCHPRSADITEI
jgi:hypothetical protein